jgi:hypothetical protein
VVVGHIVGNGGHVVAGTVEEDEIVVDGIGSEDVDGSVVRSGEVMGMVDGIKVVIIGEKVVVIDGKISEVDGISSVVSENSVVVVKIGGVLVSGISVEVVVISNSVVVRIEVTVDINGFSDVVVRFGGTKVFVDLGLSVVELIN